MSFVPGGGRGNGQPPFPNAGNFVPPGIAPGVPLPVMPGMPPMGGMPGVPQMFPGGMMPPIVPGMGAPAPMPPFPVSYPQGQGPLAERPVTIGANGLLTAPTKEGPVEHEGKQFMQLNVAEGVKYGELWADASDGAETVSGAQFAELMQRATKVSKSQLRTIWQLADHRQEGALGRDEFFIAMRLLALAQRGAELSMKGMRNFVGIQLLPEVGPKPEPRQPPPTSSTDALPPNANVAPAASGFSWTVPRELIKRYDKFFESLDAERIGIIDGRQGFTFFMKSGLPRQTLREIWQLADITVDGKLDREEFRQAMHLVTGVKNGRITVEQLPERLHPSTENWLREVDQEIPSILEPVNSGYAQPQAPLQPPPPPPPADSQPSEQSYSERSSSAPDLSSPAVSSVPGMPGRQGMPGQYGLPQGASNSADHLAYTPPPAAPLTSLRSGGSEAEDIMAELQKQRLEAEKVRRDMELMQAELQRVRLEAASAASQKAQLDEMTAAKEKAEADAAHAKAELVKAGMNRSSQPASVPIPAPLPPMANLSMEPPKPVGLLTTTPEKKSVMAENPRPKIEDDDIWDQPSPEMSKPKAPANVGMSSLTMPAAASVQQQPAAEDESSDDDDFWGMGAKPTLGTAPKANNNGKSENLLDDWF